MKPQYNFTYSWKQSSGTWDIKESLEDQVEAQLDALQGNYPEVQSLLERITDATR